MQHSARQDAIYREVDAALHEVQPVKPKVPQKRLLYSTHHRGGLQADIQVLLERRISLLQQSLKLWSMVHYHHQVVVCVNVGDEVIASDPRRAAIIGVV